MVIWLQGLVGSDGSCFFFLIPHSTTILFFSSSRTPLSELGGFLPTSIGEAEGKVCKSCFLFAVRLYTHRHTHTHYLCATSSTPLCPASIQSCADFQGAAPEEGRGLLWGLPAPVVIRISLPSSHSHQTRSQCLTRRRVRDFGRAVYF